MKKKYMLGYILVMVLAVVIAPIQTWAVKGDSLGLTPIYPENQTGGETGYFNLKVTPGQEQDIELEIRNDSSAAVTVDVTCLQAATSDAGVITYNEEKEIDASTAFPFKKIATLEKNEVTIPASTSEKIRVHLKVPVEAFTGKIIGGLTVSEKRELTSEEKKQSVVNEFQYAIPIILFESEDKVEPELTLENVEPGLRNYRPFIEATLVNQAPINISTMEISGKIISKKDNKLVIERKELTYKMAPNSSFNYGFDLQNSKVKEGNYVADFTIIADGKTFHLKKEFTISKAKAEEVNSQNLYSDEDAGFSWWWLILVGIAGVLLVVLFLLIYRKKQRSKKKQLKKRKQSVKVKTKAQRKPNETAKAKGSRAVARKPQSRENQRPNTKSRGKNKR